MSQAARDENGVPTMLAHRVGGVNEFMIYPVRVNETNHALKVADGISGVDQDINRGVRDQNNVPIMLAVSSSDETSIVSLYCDKSGYLLIQSTQYGSS